MMRTARGACSLQMLHCPWRVLHAGCYTCAPKPLHHHVQSRDKANIWLQIGAPDLVSRLQAEHALIISSLADAGSNGSATTHAALYKQACCLNITLVDSFPPSMLTYIHVGGRSVCETAYLQ